MSVPKICLACNKKETPKHCQTLGHIFWRNCGKCCEVGCDYVGESF